ncbi:hypothetical protein [Bradyrhizobium sp. BTAi1]|uniref:hypothetical protein n=1 Tax=Bradyrhizobium sp. (strain BTAi1 / ATCC BAA-1182) TaxID=288000 RepID=UPI0005A2F9A6|nr:hypothetical protein [Bradyrhizobium sp. BTAi1]
MSIAADIAEWLLSPWIASLALAMTVVAGTERATHAVIASASEAIQGPHETLWIMWRQCADFTSSAPGN